MASLVFTAVWLLSFYMLSFLDNNYRKYNIFSMFGLAHGSRFMLSAGESSSGLPPYAQMPWNHEDRLVSLSKCETNPPKISLVSAYGPSVIYRFLLLGFEEVARLRRLTADTVLFFNSICFTRKYSLFSGGFRIRTNRSEWMTALVYP